MVRNITSHMRVLQHFLFNRCRLVRRCLACWDRPLNVCDLTPRFPRRRKCLLPYWSLYGWCGLITRMSFYLWQMGRNTSILFRGNDSFCSKNNLQRFYSVLKRMSARDSFYMRIWLNGHCKEILFWRCSSGELNNCGLYTRRLEYIIDGKIEAFKIK